MKAKSTLRLILLQLGCIAWVASLTAQPLSGNYTIDSALPTAGANFQSFNDFAASINANGVADHVVATVEPGSGPYQEQVVFSNIPGAGPDATITLEGSGETISAVTSSTSRHVVRLANCQYFTVNNLHVDWDPASTGGFYAIHVFDTGNHITISNCEVDISGTNSTLYGAYIVSGSETSILEGGDFHNILITQNSAQGGGYGASVFGLVSPLASNIVISHNQFLNAHSNAVYIRETDGVVIHDNFIDKNTANVTSWNAIQLAQAANINGRIYNNYIQVSQTANGTQTFRGIYLFNGIGHRVYNNVITNINLEAGNVTGIEVRTGATAPEIYFNTISIDKAAGTTGNLAGIAESLTNTNSILRNNTISISQPSTGMKSGLVLATNSTPSSAFNSNYNILHVPGGNAAQKGTLVNPIFYPTLSNWQGISGQDANSYDLDPEFISAILPQPTNLALDNKGTSIADITVDYLGVNRGAVPDIGAYEFGDCPPPNAPGAISGENEWCINATGASFSIDPVPGAIGYSWTVPSGSTINSGQGSTSISVDFGTLSGNITAAVEDSCGLGPAAILTINLLTAPPAPAGIAGPSAVCSGETGVTYAIQPVAGANSYTWTLPAGASIASGQGSTIITADIGSASGGTISVIAQNDCGSSGATTYTLLVFPPTTVTLDIPQDTVCIGDGPLTLSGDPIDAIFSGPGVEGGIFDPEIAGPGTHLITLSYEDEFGCTFSDTEEIVVELCSGLKDQTGLNQTTAYPNPGTGIFRLQGGMTREAGAEVFNLQGHLILKKDLKTDSIIDLSNYPNGVYLLRLRNGGRTEISRIVITR